MSEGLGQRILYLLFVLLNFFFLDRDTRKCARYHGDKHLNKMVTEYAQIVSAVWWINAGTTVTEHVKTHIYKLSHANHPVVKWACKSVLHYNAIIDLGLALVEEKQRRILNMQTLPKTQQKKWKPDHQSAPILTFCKANPPLFDPATHLWEDPPKCMPENYWKDEQETPFDVVMSYRLFYSGTKVDVTRLKWLPFVEEPDFLAPCQDYIKKRDDIRQLIRDTQETDAATKHRRATKRQKKE